MKIKYLVLPGCGPNILQLFGAVKKAKELNYWKHEDLREIYCTSAGSILAFLIALDIDMGLIRDYLIQRPWHKLIPKSNILLKNLYESGIIDKLIFTKTIESFFKVKNIDLDINLYEFYKITKIKLIIYTTNLNEFECKKMTHKSHPDLSLMDALYMSCTIPLIFKPLRYQNSYFLDGGIFKHYPIMDVTKAKKQATLAINMISLSEEISNEELYNNSNISNYKLLKVVINKYIHYCKGRDKQSLSNEIRVILPDPAFRLSTWTNFLYKSRYRESRIKDGEKYTLLFDNRQKLNTEIQAIDKDRDFVNVRGEY